VPTPKFELPSWLGYSRYVVLVVLVLAIPYFFGEEHPLFFCRVCPAGALEAALPHTASTALAGGGIAWPSVTKDRRAGRVPGGDAVYMAAVVYVAVPAGSHLQPVQPRVAGVSEVPFDRCNDCDLCRRLCRYHGLGQRRGDDQRCIRCLDCTRCTAVTLSHVFQSETKESG
jgi:ferredoxin-type protein NapH